MKRFIKHILIFFLLVLVVFGINGIFNYFQLKKIPSLGATETLIIGDSRVMTAINPELIPNSKNIAQNSESYIISYYKLKSLLLKENKVKRVVLSFSYPSFSAYLDGIFKDDIATADVFGRIYPIMRPKDFGNLEVDKFKYYKVLFKQMFVYPHFNHHQYMGGFTRLKYGLDKADLEGVLQRHYFDKDSNNIGISICASQYLDSIVDLTKQKNIELVLVNIPFQKKYLERVPFNFVEYYNQQKSRMIKNGVTVLDYSQVQLPDQYFKDYNHLDIEGADFFTEMLKRDIPE
jgi:hypothetical protein